MFPGGTELEFLEIRDVRNVAPFKKMLRASFVLPQAVIFGENQDHLPVAPDVGSKRPAAAVRQRDGFEGKMTDEGQDEEGREERKSKKARIVQESDQ